MAKPTILVIGSLNADLITRTSRIPAPGETLTSISFDTGSGGKGANQAVACARLSRRRDAVDEGDVIVHMMGAVGDDIFGQDLLRGLNEDGIDTSKVQVRKGEKTGVSTIIVEAETGENRILFSPNANYTLEPRDFASLPDMTRGVIVLQLEIPLDTVLQILKAAHDRGTPVIFNPAPAIALPSEAYKCITHLIVNESEAAILSGDASRSLSATADHFHSLGVQYVTVTLGSQGAFSSEKGKEPSATPAEKVRAVDTTAAGDTFVGAYAVEVARSMSVSSTIHAFDLSHAVRVGTLAASKTVQRHGAQVAIPWMDEI